MNASHLVRRILNSVSPDKQPAILLAISTAVVFVLVAVASHSANALDCPAFPKNSCSYGGASVPCSNTTFCYTESSGNLCNSGPIINRFKNTNPPSSWTRCKGKTGAGSCNENPQQCGIAEWYWGGYCDIDHKCTAAYVMEWCKGPAADPTCL